MATSVTKSSGSRPADEGGESACWAHLVCPECGAIESDGHRVGCSSVGGVAEADRAEQHTVHRIIVWIAIMVPAFAAFFALLVFIAVHIAGVAAGAPVAMGAGAGALAGIFFGMWVGVVVSVSELEHSNLVLRAPADSSAP